MARHRFGEREALFRSAGFLEGDRECPDHLLQSLRERGVDAAAHRSYRIDQASLQAADLVLTMEGEHVQKATLLDPDSFHKVLPLKEAAARLENVGRGPLTLDEFVDEINRDRDPTSYLSGQWDVSDPYGRKLRDYRRAVNEIAGLVDGVIPRLS